MRRAFPTIIIIICLTLPLCGCTGVYSERKDLDGLKIVELLGIDTLSEGVRLSLSVGSEKDEAVYYVSEGGSISYALENAKSSACDGDLFCAHISSVIVGENAARDGLESCFEYICRSPDVRIDVDMFAVQSDSAENAVTGVGSDAGAAQLVSRLKQASKNHARMHIYSAAEIISRTDECGSALICGLESVKPADNGGSEGTALVPGGYGILDNYRLISWLDPSLSPIIGILENRSYVSEINVDGAIMQLEHGEAQVFPIWDSNGNLDEVQVRVSVRASVLESDSHENAAVLTAKLEKTVLHEVMNVIRREKSSGCDFLAIGSRIELHSPVEYRRLERPFSEILPSLRFSVAVSGAISHTNDTRNE